MPKKLTKSIVRSVRLPQTLWEDIERHAQKNKRTIASELILWLEMYQQRQ